MKERTYYHDPNISNRERIVLENLWLEYFNSVLLKKGVISEAIYKRMQREIWNRPVAKRKSG